MTGLSGFHENGLLTEVEVGTARGVRAFSVDDKGRLNSLFVPHIWKPGVNVAKGFNVKRDLYGDPQYSPVADLRAHGFYSYHNGHDQYEKSDRVTGVIENSGEVTIGELGFRSENAKIVAVYLPDVKKVPKLNQIEKFLVSQSHTSAYSGTTMSPWWWLIFAALLILPVALFLPLAITVSAWFFLGGIGLITAPFMFKFTDKALDKKDSIQKVKEFNVIASRMAKVRYAYGDKIEYFNDRSKMLKAYPLYQLPKPTPDDEEFWK